MSNSNGYTNRIIIDWIAFTTSDDFELGNLIDFEFEYQDMERGMLGYKSMAIEQTTKIKHQERKCPLLFLLDTLQTHMLRCFAQSVDRCMLQSKTCLQTQTNSIPPISGCNIDFPTNMLIALS